MSECIPGFSIVTNNSKWSLFLNQIGEKEAIVTATKQKTQRNCMECSADLKVTG